MAGKREAIKNAFIEMIEKMSIEQIRTEMLLQRADVSKATFYRLFRDKYDVMNSVYMDLSFAKVQEDPALHNWKEWTIHDFQNILAHKTFFRHIISYQGQNSLREVAGQFYRENILRQIEKEVPKEKISERLLYLVDAFVEVNVFTLLWYIKKDCQIEMQEVVDYVEACIPTELKPYFLEKSLEEGKKEKI